ncbi:MAG: IS630 family transposase [Kiritimatiellae bacterium]|nr:IS630 family transposase [Kiritimatiellia bacterium]
MGWAAGIKETLHASEQDRADVNLLRKQWIQEVAKLDPSRLVFIDESGAKTNMTRLRGRALGGNRLFAKTPHGHWCTTTLTSSVRLDGTTAAMEGEGATETAVFGEYIRRVLLPTLSPEDIVIMDNLRVHHNPKVIELIESCGAHVRFLPPYSPDSNPIEKMWGKIKNRLGSLAARSQQELSEAITQAFEEVSPDEVIGWFSSCYIATPLS